MSYTSKKIENINSKDTCTPMFTAALFTIGKIWKQPKCLSIDERIKEMWYTHITHTRTRAHTHTLEYYSAIKKKEILTFATTWMDTEVIILSEVSQREKKILLYM